MTKQTKRTAFYVTERNTLNGADTMRVLYMHSAGDAYQTVRKYIPRNRRDYFRIVSCVPATAEQIAEHKARMATI